MLYAFPQKTGSQTYILCLRDFQQAPRKVHSSLPLEKCSFGDWFTREERQKDEVKVLSCWRVWSELGMQIWVSIAIFCMWIRACEPFFREPSLLIQHASRSYVHKSWGTCYFRYSQPWNSLPIWVGGYCLGVPCFPGYNCVTEPSLERKKPSTELDYAVPSGVENPGVHRSTSILIFSYLLVLFLPVFSEDMLLEAFW